MRSQPIIHRYPHHRHPTSNKVTRKSVEGKGRGRVDEVHVNDVEVRGGENSHQAVAEENTADDRDPDAY